MEVRNPGDKASGLQDPPGEKQTHEVFRVPDIGLVPPRTAGWHEAKLGRAGERAYGQMLGRGLGRSSDLFGRPELILRARRLLALFEQSSLSCDWPEQETPRPPMNRPARSPSENSCVVVTLSDPGAEKKGAGLEAGSNAACRVPYRRHLANMAGPSGYQDSVLPAISRWLGRGMPSAYQRGRRSMAPGFRP